MVPGRCKGIVVVAINSTMKIALCGNISLDAWASALDNALSGNEIIVGAPNAFDEELRNRFDKVDFCIIVLDWRDLAPDLYAYAPGDTLYSVVSNFRAACNRLNTSMIAYRKKFNARFLVFSPISDTYSQTGFINRILLPSPSELFCDCQKIFNETCRCLNETYPIDMEEFSSRIGKMHFFDEHARCAKGQPFSSLATFSTAEYLSHVFQQFNLRVTVKEADPDSLPRIVQLLNKTNQYNLTTARYSQGEIENLLENENNHVFCMTMTDKFGDYGIIAAAVIKRNSIDSFTLR